MAWLAAWAEAWVVVWYGRRGQEAVKISKKEYDYYSFRKEAWGILTAWRLWAGVLGGCGARQKGVQYAHL